jgi:hypothetical protein
VERWSGLKSGYCPVRLWVRQYTCLWLSLAACPTRPREGALWNRWAIILMPKGADSMRGRVTTCLRAYGRTEKRVRRSDGATADRTAVQLGRLSTGKPRKIGLIVFFLAQIRRSANLIPVSPGSKANLDDRAEGRWTCRGLVRFATGKPDRWETHQTGCVESRPAYPYLPVTLESRSRCRRGRLGVCVGECGYRSQTDNGSHKTLEPFIGR